MARIKNEVEEQAQGGSGAAADPIEQVRELLFGASKRATDDNLRGIEDKMEAMRADFLSRIASLESRLVDLARDTERDRAASIEAIGGAIAQLGATIQNMSARKKGG